MSYLINSAPTSPTGTLSTGIDTDDTTIVLTGAYDEMPEPSGGDVAPLLIHDADDPTIYEWVYVTARTAGTCTIVRAREGTTALAWTAGAQVEHGLPPGAFTQQAAGFVGPRKLGTGATDAAAGDHDHDADYEAAGAVTTHASDTTSVHGITDTADLIVEGDERLPAKLFAPYFMWMVAAATTGNITLSGAQTIDGVSVAAGQSVLVKDQADAAENGIWECAAGEWSRNTNFNTDEAVFRSHVVVAAGTVNADKVFANSNTTPAVIGTDDVTYVEIGATGTALDINAVNRMAVDLLGFLLGDVTVNGAWTFADVLVSGVLTIGLLETLGVATPDGIAITIGEATTNADGDLAILLSNDVGALYIGGPKIATDYDVDLELKAGGGSTSLQGIVYLNGGVRHKTVTKTANYTMDRSDHTVAYTTLSAARTVTLPALSAVADGQEYEILDATTGTHADTNNLTIQRAGSDLFVGGGTSTVISTANGYRRIRKVNSRWMVVCSG